MLNADNILSRMRLASKSQNDSDLSSLLGVSLSGLCQFRARDAVPFKHASFIADKFNISLDWLIFGRNQYEINHYMKKTANSEAVFVNISTEAQKEEDVILIKHYDIEVSAGFGTLDNEDAVKSNLAFKKEWLLRKGLDPSSLSIVKVRGDSMTPTFQNEDLVLVNHKKKTVEDGRIYVLRLDQGLVVKRVQWLPGGAFSIISDNKAYQTNKIDPAVGDTVFDVIGQVACSMHDWS